METNNKNIVRLYDGHAGLMSLELDSGTSEMASRAVEEMDLETRKLPIIFYSRNGSALTRLASFRKLVIDRASLGKGEFLISTDESGPARLNGEPILGSLGTAMFLGIDFELDLAHRKLNIFSPRHCKGSVVYWAKDWGSAPLFIGDTGNLYFPVELEHKRVQAGFSPGYRYSLLATDVSRRLYGFDASSEGVETVTGPDGEVKARYRAMRLTAASMEVKNTRIELVDPPGWANGKPSRFRCLLTARNWEATGYSNCGNVVPMYLGRNLLERLRFYFATSERVVYFTLADTTTP